MPHEFSVRIHDWITEKMEKATAAAKTAEENGDAGSHAYFSGQLKELAFIRQYLTDKIDLDTQSYYP